MSEKILHSVKSSDELLDSDPALFLRIAALEEKFILYFNAPPEIGVRSPGRAEIIGNHTDYNGGSALACALPQSIIALFRRRSDRIFRLRSENLPGDRHEFNIDELSPGDSTWARYPKAVVAELSKRFPALSGADVLVQSTIPFAGGLSTSAALEVAIALGVQKLNDIEMERISTAQMCRSAENGPFIGVPSGLLDQASVLLSERDTLILFDFGSIGEQPCNMSHIHGTLDRDELQFILTIDPLIQRTLGESGYRERRRDCEAAVEYLEPILQRPLPWLCEVSSLQFQEVREELLKRAGGRVTCRAEHIVHENERVREAGKAWAAGRWPEFGQLLTESGESALNLFGLDEGTPELTHLVRTAREVKGVVGTRNMGGGFSAVTLSLVFMNKIENFRSLVQQRYQDVFRRQLQFISFTPEGPATIL